MGFTFGTVAFLLLAYTSAYYLLEDDDVTVSVIWPDEYYFKAERIDVLAGDVQGFEVWRSSEHNRTHVSYYDGVKEMYYTDETDESYGSVSVIYTKTDKSLDNFVVCEEKSSDSDASFLPDLTGYTNKVETTLDGKPVTVWRAENAVEGEGKTEKTLCVYRTEYGFDIPIQETEKTYSFEKGNLEEYTQINFKSFEYKVSLQDVTVPKDSECLYEGVLGRHFQSDLKYLQPHLPGHLDKAYFSFRRHHNKIYEKHEQDLRKRIFHKNWKMVLEHNRKNLGYKLELNQFADYTDEEFMMMTGTRPSKGIGEGTIPMDIEMLEEDLPESYDLRLNGHMRPIRNQGGCGSCWAFTTTAVVEGALSVANGGRNLDLSEQSMVDCAWGYGNDGCSGGELEKALQYLVDKGLPTEFEYGPYKHIDGKCHLTNVSDVYKIKGFSKVTPGNPVAMKAALVKYGPLAVAVYAGSKMKSYSSGILYDVECDEESVNHGVVVVGYGEREGTPYWIIRNSWGETWGEDGYMLISAVNDNCHVMDTAYYVVV